MLRFQSLSQIWRIMWRTERRKSSSSQPLRPKRPRPLMRNTSVCAYDGPARRVAKSMTKTSLTLEQRIVSRRALLLGSVLCALNSRVRADEEQPANAYGVSALTEGTGMVHIPPGEFHMGSERGNEDEEPIHRVRITHGFDMSKFEVTQAQWEGVLAEAHPQPGVPLLNGDGVEVSRTPSHFKGRSLPVESVSWSDVHLFLGRLNVRQPAYVYRLPTEAEWE